MQILCLAFMAAVGTNPPPPQIKKLIESRVQKQWSEHRPDLSLTFDDETCPEQGSYEYANNILKLNSDTEYWHGRLSTSIEDLLSGKKLDFSAVSTSAQMTQQSTQKNTKWKKWLPWGIAIISAGTSAWLIHDRNEHIKKLQGLKISF